MRYSGRDAPIDDQVQDLLRDLRDSGLLDGTLMKHAGRIKLAIDDEEDDDLDTNEGRVGSRTVHFE